MRLPGAFGEPEVCEGSREGRGFGAARIHAHIDLVRPLEKMGDAHLAKVDTVLRAFHAEVALPAAEPVVHAALGGRNVGGGPVGIAMIGDDTAQALKALILVLDGRFQPVVAVLVDQHAALIETSLAVEGRSYDE